MDLTKSPAATSPAASRVTGTTPKAPAALTYTSFGDGTGPGGWQIKQVAGQLSQAEQDGLVKRIATAFDPSRGCRSSPVRPRSRAAQGD